MRVKTNTIVMLLFCLIARGPCFAAKPNIQIYGDVESTWNFGREETYVDTGFGLQKISQEKDYRHLDVNVDGQVSWMVDRLRFNFSDRLDVDIYSQKNQISRNSNYQNFAQFEGDYFIHDNMRVKGILSYDIFEDESFPEFSTNDFAAKLEIERKLRRNTFLTTGYEAHDLEFDTSSFDNYNQQDLYLSFYRFSPEKNTYKHHRSAPSGYQPGMLKKSMFKDSTANYLSQLGLSNTASLIPMIDLDQEIDTYIPYQIQSNMAFELEARIRNRELYNSLEKSFLEAQINGVVQFFFNAEHNFRIENHYYDREYARESQTDNLFHYQRNETLFSHYYAVNRFVFDHRLSIDQYFHRDQSDWDSFHWVFDSAVSYDIMRRWNLSYYNSWSQIDYDVPRQFFTNNEYNFHSFSTSYRISNKLKFTATFDSESKNVKFFENSIDSSFRKRARDLRLEYKFKRLWGAHTGYKWERESHRIFEVNDRYEAMAYVGASIQL